MDPSTHDFPSLSDVETWFMVRDEDEETFDDGSRLVMKPEDEGWVNYEVKEKIPYAKVILQQGRMRDQTVPVLTSDEEDATLDIVIVPDVDKLSEPTVAPNENALDTEEEEEEEKKEEKEEEEKEGSDWLYEYGAYGDQSDEDEHGDQPEEEAPVEPSTASSSESHAKGDEAESSTIFSEQEMHKLSHRTKHDNDVRQKRRDKRLQRELKLEEFPSIDEFKWTPKEDGRIRPNLHPKQVDHEMQKQWKKLLKSRRATKSFSGDSKKKAIRHDLSV